MLDRGLSLMDVEVLVEYLKGYRVEVGEEAFYLLGAFFELAGYGEHLDPVAGRKDDALGKPVAVDELFERLSYGARGERELLPYLDGRGLMV